MAARSERLSSVHDVKSHEEDRFAGELAAARKELHQAELQLEELYAYREEYIQGVSGTNASGTSVEALQQQRSFYAKLEQAIGQQREKVAYLVTRYDDAHHRWLERHNRQLAMSKAIDRMRDEENASAERSEQKLLDELTAGRTGRTPRR